MPPRRPRAPRRPPVPAPRRPRARFRRRWGYADATTPWPTRKALARQSSGLTAPPVVALDETINENMFIDTDEEDE